MRLIRMIIPLVSFGGLLMTRCDCGTAPIPILSPDPRGSYNGLYTWKTGEGPTADSLVQAIKWTFTETNYLMDADTSASLYDPSVCFCKGRGTYAITDRVRLEPVDPETAIPDNCDTCDPAQSPQGFYALERPEAGIRLTKIEVIDGIQVTSKITLEPDFGE